VDQIPDPEPTAVFVYGTLKQGHVRSGRWPRPPQSIAVATIRAQLFDLGPYPGILPGDDLVAGEMWCFQPDDMRETLAALDAVEGFGQGGRDLYLRRVVEAVDEQGVGRAAYAYFFARPDKMQAAIRLAPGPDGRCRWPAYHAGSGSA
jgi:gamma-glutamylcyclotransferase (GGCT)/AIG2-like uncharacterized protein YtfP